MLNLDPGMIVWTWITFFIVFGLLVKYALNPMITAINNREESIRNDIESAEKQRTEAEELLEEHKKMMQGAEEKSREIIKENQHLAEKTRQEVIDAAKQEAEKFIIKAKEELERQKDTALSSLKAEVADLAVGAAEKIMVQSLDAKKQTAIVDEYINTMPKESKN
jgi:F-type H+-transporting ATPase subunit b